MSDRRVNANVLLHPNETGIAAGLTGKVFLEGSVVPVGYDIPEEYLVEPDESDGPAVAGFTPHEPVAPDGDNDFEVEVEDEGEEDGLEWVDPPLSHEDLASMRVAEIEEAVGDDVNTARFVLDFETQREDRTPRKGLIAAMEAIVGAD